MSKKYRKVVIAVICVGSIVYTDNALSQEAQGDAKEIQGLWHGSWGGGESDGVVYQPVLAELVVEANQVEMHGFPNTSSLTGTVEIDTRAKLMRITPATERGRTTDTVPFKYELRGNTLTVIGADEVAVALHRLDVARSPWPGARVEFVEATGIDDTGNLLVTEFTVLQAQSSGANYFQPNRRVLETKQAAIYVVQENGLKELAIDEVRERLEQPMPVVIAFRPDGRPQAHQPHVLWRDMGPPRPDNEAVLKTLARFMRTDTLVFILPARDIPLP